MAVGKITKAAVDALQPGSVLWDSTLKGFGCRCREGGTRTYVVQYRFGKGRSAPVRKYTVGVHGAPFTPETARREAARLLGIVAQGGDPAGDVAAGKATWTVAQLAEAFIAQHAEAKRKPRTAAEYRRLLTLHVLPAIGKLKVTAVTHARIARLHHDMRATPYQANRAAAVLARMFVFAAKHGHLPAGSVNPARGLDKFDEHGRERMLSHDETARLGAALAAADAGAPYAVAAIGLLLFTGARLREVLTLQWEWVDFERGVARLPDSKTGAKTLHLPPPALAILADLPRIEGNPHVIVGRKPGAALVNLEKPWRAIRAAAGLDDVRLHDLRHSYASVGASGGMSLHMLSKLLGHSQPGTTHRYAHLAPDPAAAAAATIAAEIAARLAGTPAAGNVVALPVAKGR